MTAAPERSRYVAWKRLGFLLPLTLPALPAQAWWLAQRGALAPDAAAWLGVVMIFAVLPLLDLAVGSDPVSPTDEEALGLARDPYYRALLLLCVPAQLASLAFGVWAWRTGSCRPSAGSAGCSRSDRSRGRSRSTSRTS